MTVLALCRSLTKFQWRWRVSLRSFLLLVHHKNWFRVSVLCIWSQHVCITQQHSGFLIERGCLMLDHTLHACIVFPLFTVETSASGFSCWDDLSLLHWHNLETCWFISVPQCQMTTSEAFWKHQLGLQWLEISFTYKNANLNPFQSCQDFERSHLKW